MTKISTGYVAISIGATATLAKPLLCSASRYQLQPSLQEKHRESFHLPWQGGMHYIFKYLSSLRVKTNFPMKMPPAFSCVGPVARGIMSVSCVLVISPVQGLSK